MKKIVALLLIIGCLVTVLSLPVGAASNNEVDFIVNADGENITLDVKTNFSCGSIQGALLFDDDEISYSDVNIDAAISSKNKAVDSIKKGKGVTKFAFVGDVNNGTTGSWATITYTGDKSKFDISSFKAYAASGTEINADVYVVFRGDANTDGLLDIRDSVALKKIAFNTRDIEKIYSKNIDVDASGEWEPAVDMTAFKKYMFSIF